jgi:hypothetical protein
MATPTESLYFHAPKSPNLLAKLEAVQLVSLGKMADCSTSTASNFSDVMHQQWSFCAGDQWRLVADTFFVGIHYTLLIMKSEGTFS